MTCTTLFGLEGQIRNNKITHQFIETCLEYLKIHRFKSRYIQISFQNDIGGAEGLCSGDTEYVDILIAKKCPYDGRKFTYLEMMKTLGHELVHARQLLRGQLTCENGFAWKGRQADGWEYENQPWEKEAYRIEDEMFLKCFPLHLKFKQ